MEKVIFTPEELKVIMEHARLAELGGTSRIRNQDRATTLKKDQLTGQLGEAALSKLITGNIMAYHKNRIEREKNPWKGDGGSDIPGLQVDVKTSRMRAGENHKYWLWVRQREYHPETCYYLALVPEGKDDTVYFAGWVIGKFMDKPSGSDRYECRMDKLNDMKAGQE